MAAHPRRSIHYLLGAIASFVAGLLATSVLGPAPSASAFAITDSWGVFGTVSQEGPMLRAVGDDRSSVVLEVAALTLHAAVLDSGIDQGSRVLVQYTLQGLDDGAWKDLQTSPAYTRTIDAGGSQTLPAWEVENPADDARRHDYRIAVDASWIDVATNYPIGGAVIAPAQWGDTACETAEVILCEPVFGGLSVIGAAAM